MRVKIDWETDKYWVNDWKNESQIKTPRVTPLEGVYTYCFAIRGRGVENPQGFGIDKRRFVAVNRNQLEGSKAKVFIK